MDLYKTSRRGAFVLIVFVLVVQLHRAYLDGSYSADWNANKSIRFPIKLEVHTLEDNTSETTDSAVSIYDSQEKVRRLPNCIIIGVRKGGTFALLRFLNIHPDILIPDSPEIHFFDRNDLYQKGLAFYRRLMPKSSPGQITLEKTPEYFTRTSVPARIMKMNSSIRLLLTVRDPITRLISDFAMKRSKYPQKYPSFQSVVLNELGEINENYTAVSFSTYHVHLSRWLQYFSREQIYIVDGDEFAINPFKEINSIESFLGLRHAVTKKNIIYNEDKGFFCIKMKKGDEPQCMPPGKGREHPDVKPTVLKKLQNYFKPLNEKFYAMSGKTFDWD